MPDEAMDEVVESIVKIYEFYQPASASNGVKMLEERKLFTGNIIGTTTRPEFHLDEDEV
jgi:hypothetical protein